LIDQRRSPDVSCLIRPKSRIQEIERKPRYQMRREEVEIEKNSRNLRNG